MGGPSQSNQTAVLLDFETCSELNLSKVGAVRYSCHPSTRVICYSWIQLQARQRHGSNYYYEPHADTPEPIGVIGDVMDAKLRQLIAGGAIVFAHGALFERSIWRNTLWRSTWSSSPPISRWRDTMAMAGWSGLPLGLEAAGEAAGLPVTKDAVGRRFMLQLARPRKVDPDGTIHWWHEEDPPRLQRVLDYCKQDVLAELALLNVVHRLPIGERAIYEATMAMNERGVGVDASLVAVLHSLTEFEKTRLDSQLEHLTASAVPNTRAVKVLLGWINTKLQARRQKPMWSLGKAEIKQRLKDTQLPDDIRAVLVVRQKAARTSTAKLNVMQRAAVRWLSNTGVVHGTMQYYGAWRTGRWAGRLLQVQNFTRPDRGVDVRRALTLLRNDRLLGDLRNLVQAIKLFVHDDVMGVVASCLRACLTSGTDQPLVVADSSAIEARVLPWLAGAEWLLDLFRQQDRDKAAGIKGVDVYTAVAHRLGSDDRQLGKLGQLSLGYQTGAPKLRETARDVYDIELSMTEAEKLVEDWRGENPEIVGFWKQLETAAFTAVKHPDRSAFAGEHIWFKMIGPHLHMYLPSGRRLIYRDAEILPDPKFGRPTVSFMGENQYTHQWERMYGYGGLWANNATQGVARDVLAEDFLWAENTCRNLEPLMLVHDETVCRFVQTTQRSTPERALERLILKMSEERRWAPGLPLMAEGYVAMEFRK